jgi:aminoglycoside phosphotransferase (APT) family kinase protein
MRSTSQGGVAVSGIVDFGDITAGDPATDLAIAWMLLPANARPLFRLVAGHIDDHTWSRARGWALALGLTLIATSADNPAMGRVGRYTVEAVLADA